MNALSKTEKCCDFIQKITAFFAFYSLYEITIFLFQINLPSLSQYCKWHENTKLINPQAASSLCEIGFGLNLAVNLLNQAQNKLSDYLKSVVYQWGAEIVEAIETGDGLFFASEAPEELVSDWLNNIENINTKIQDSLPALLRKIESNLTKQCFVISSYLLLISFLLAYTSHQTASVVILLQITYVAAASFIAFFLCGFICYASCKGIMYWFMLKCKFRNWLTHISNLLSKWAAGIAKSFK